MKRALVVGVGLVLVAGCTNNTASTDDGSPPREATREFCVAFVEAFMVHGAVEAAEFGRQLERGEGTTVEDNPYESAPFRRFVDSAPDDLQDDIALVTRLPLDPTPEWRAAADRVDERIAVECYIGEHASSPLTAECNERAIQLRRALRDDAVGAGDFEQFGSECPPDTNPYQSLPEACQGVVYSQFVVADADGVVRSGARESGEEEAALYLDTCGPLSE